MITGSGGYRLYNWSHISWHGGFENMDSAKRYAEKKKLKCYPYGLPKTSVIRLLGEDTFKKIYVDETGDTLGHFPIK